jgi:hypothetical protein
MDPSLGRRPIYIAQHRGAEATDCLVVRPPTLLETEASTQRANAIYESCIDRGEETQLDALYVDITCSMMLHSMICLKWIMSGVTRAEFSTWHFAST